VTDRQPVIHCNLMMSSITAVFNAMYSKSAINLLDVDLISASVSAPNVDKWALSADIWFRPKAVVPHSVHFRFHRAAVGKFGGC